MKSEITYLSWDFLYLRSVAHKAIDGLHVTSGRQTKASSYEPGRAGWLGLQDLPLPPFSLQKFRCVHMTRRAGPVTEISVLRTEQMVGIEKLTQSRYNVGLKSGLFWYTISDGHYQNWQKIRNTAMPCVR